MEKQTQWYTSWVLLDIIYPMMKTPYSPSNNDMSVYTMTIMLIHF